MRKLDYSRIGMRIRQVRKAKGWSQDELAKKCGISMSFLGHIERGSRVMSMDTFVGICNALDAGADELLWGEAVKSSAVLHMWGSAREEMSRKPMKQDGNQADSYAMYIRIMKSVAEIMNEAEGSGGMVHEV